MSATATPRTLPVVVLLYTVPLFAEAFAGVFDGLAELRPFPVNEGTEGLLRSVRPDALIVEADVTGAAIEYADEAGMPLVRVDLKGGTIETTEGDSLPGGPVEIRNAIVGALMRRRA